MSNTIVTSIQEQVFNIIIEELNIQDHDRGELVDGLSHVISSNPSITLEGLKDNETYLYCVKNDLIISDNLLSKVLKMVAKPETKKHPNEVDFKVLRETEKLFMQFLESIPALHKEKENYQKYLKSMKNPKFAHKVSKLRQRWK